MSNISHSNFLDESTIIKTVYGIWLMIISGSVSPITAASDLHRAPSFGVPPLGNPQTFSSVPQGMKIILVEDEVSWQGSFKRGLASALGVPVDGILVADHASAAMSIYSKIVPTVWAVLSDIEMPGVDGTHDGFALREALRAADCVVPLILWSGRLALYPIEVARATSDRRTTVFSKPFPMPTIAKTFFSLWAQAYEKLQGDL